jgi:hypothetical protein
VAKSVLREPLPAGDLGAQGHQHPELRWVQRHAPVSGQAYLDAAEGFTPAENVHSTRRWTGYHSADVAATGPDKDVLTGLVWETDPVTLQRKPRTEYVSMDCPEQDQTREGL